MSAVAAWTAGTAVVDITPPTDHVLDSDAVKLCANAFTGPRPWALTEPYTDQNGDGDYDYPEPFCDANANQRYDGMYLSSGIDNQAKQVHDLGAGRKDLIDARAVAFSDGTRTAVVLSVVSQGLFENYTHQIRNEVRARTANKVDDIIVSANHNESSPDSIGIYGAPEGPEVPAGGRSGINDYYMEDFLVHRVADAAVAAYQAMKPATLWARKVPIPVTLKIRLSHNFPTTNDDESPAAVDHQVRILQARDSAGKALFTLMNLSAHNQQVGHSSPTELDISADWPGYFQRKLDDAAGFGKGIFLVGANGSEEDPETVPKLADTPQCSGACRIYGQAQATGEALAQLVMSEAPKAQALRTGSLVIDRKEFFVPLENNLFKAAAGAGLFGKRQGYASPGVPSANAPPQYLRTEVAVLDLGPDLQFLANPAEAFPALIMGSPWGIEEVPCPERRNPPVPSWHARAAFRFPVGLANDLIGYASPAWGFTSIPGAFTTTCVNDADDVDSKGHQHKLETEGAGPTASNQIADELTKLLAKRPDPLAKIRRGRFVMADGSLSRRAVAGARKALGVWVGATGATSLAPGAGAVIALQSVGYFGSRTVNRIGRFMDYDGREQSEPDVHTRGMLVRGPSGAVLERFYLDVYPTLPASPLGAARPPKPPSPPRPAPARIALTVSPTTARFGQVVRFRFLATVVTGGKRRAVAGAQVRFAKKVGRTNASGRLTIYQRFTKPNRYHPLATKPGLRGGRAHVRVVN